jgi:RNA-directed DNA polymerase
MEKPLDSFRLGRSRQAYRKAGPGKAALRGSNKPRPVRNTPDTPTSIWSLFARASTEPLKEERQMSIDLHGPIVASSDTSLRWKTLPWASYRREVKRLQIRMAKAVSAHDHRKVWALQWLLTHSQTAKYLAVKRVTENQGRHTPGVDGMIWTTDEEKFAAVDRLKRRGYQPQPLRRIYIKKKNGKLRPFSIPTMLDRAQQALYMLALQPVAESLADRNSSGFRQGRSCADAIAQCFIALAKRPAPVWVLEGDIRSCFDQISHDWLLANIPMDRTMLHKWLRAGYLEAGRLYPTTVGNSARGGVPRPC